MSIKRIKSRGDFHFVLKGHRWLGWRCVKRFYFVATTVPVLCCVYCVFSSSGWRYCVFFFLVLFCAVSRKGPSICYFKPIWGLLTNSIQTTEQNFNDTHVKYCVFVFHRRVICKKQGLLNCYIESEITDKYMARNVKRPRFVRSV